MIDLNKVEIPTSKADDVNAAFSTWKDGKCISINEGSHMTFYVAHEQQQVTDEQGNELTRTLAFPIRVQKPVTRDAAINAAEMEAYALTSAMEVASFTASMARKFRENPGDAEVLAHDEFIEFIKQELTAIGV
jgi:hypothetical protein